MLKNRKRFEDYLRMSARPFLVVDNNIWVSYEGIIQPLGPIVGNYDLKKSKMKGLLKGLNGRLVRCMTDSPDSTVEEWYSVICDNFIDITQLTSKYRSEINRGLNNCQVRQLDHEDFAKNSYEINMGAYEKYHGVKRKGYTEGAYQSGIIKLKEFSDIIHYCTKLTNLL